MKVDYDNKTVWLEAENKNEERILELMLRESLLPIALCKGKSPHQLQLQRTAHRQLTSAVSRRPL